MPSGTANLRGGPFGDIPGASGHHRLPDLPRGAGTAITVVPPAGRPVTLPLRLDRRKRVQKQGRCDQGVMVGLFRVVFARFRGIHVCRQLAVTDVGPQARDIGTRLCCGRHWGNACAGPCGLSTTRRFAPPTGSGVCQVMACPLSATIRRAALPLSAEARATGEPVESTADLSRDRPVVTDWPWKAVFETFSGA